MRKKLIFQITNVSYIKNYKLKIVFSDGHTSIVDFEEFICTSNNQDIIKYKNKKIFCRFNFKNGDLMWGDFEMIFPLIDLYKGKIN
ncbi:MAG: DUF2442 domain-containing protein [Oligoflexia bacterium]|nr:DUF2442 domain-containing protein [Oligoflexia bacterium]